MKKAKYLHTSFAGSYYEDCVVLRKRKFIAEKDAADPYLEIALKKINPSYVHKYTGSFGYEIVYLNTADNYTIKWVPEDYIKFNKEKHRDYFDKE